LRPVIFKKLVPGTKAFALVLFFWSQSLAITEENQLALIAAYVSLILFSVGNFVASAAYVWLAVAGLFCFYLGPGALALFALPVLYQARQLTQGALALVAGVVLIPSYTWLLASTSTTHFWGYQVPIGSTSFLIVGTLIVLLSLILQRRLQAASLCLLSAILAWVIVYLSLASGSIGVELFTAPWFRWLLGIPLVLGARLRAHEKESPQTYLPLKYVCLVLCLSGTFSVLLVHFNRGNIDQVIFDESHGDWESTKVSFEPQDFGRSFSYTYRVLFEYVHFLEKKALRYEGGSLDAPENSLFVLKMPTKALEEDFVTEISQWVKKGGTVLVVADHTNLFDSTHHLSPFLNISQSIEIGHTANFDKNGLPATTNIGIGGSMLGHLTGVSEKFTYLTGATFDQISYGAAILGLYGPSFSESAIYQQPNRFGTFKPSLRHAYGNHASLIAYSHGNGTVYVLADSTPWSNFSMFKSTYQDLFRHLVKVSEFKNYVRLLTLSVCAATVLLLMLIIMAENSVLVVVSLGVAAFFYVSNLTVSASLHNPFSNRHSPKVHAFVGSEATVDFLPQTIPAGTQNFSRALASLQKYGRPIRLAGTAGPTFDKSSPSNLLIYPSVEDLPSAYSCLDYVSKGGRLVILFDPHHARNLALKNWLDSLSLFIQPTRALAYLENPAYFLEDRFYQPAFRYQSFRVSALTSSHLIERSSTEIWQVFEARHQVFDDSQPAGSLRISFQANQFSDGAMGDIWDGSIPSFLSVLRERDLAGALFSGDYGGQGAVVSWSKDQAFQLSGYRPMLQNYAVTKDGAKLFSGTFGNAAVRSQDTGLGEHAKSYLGRLQYHVLKFWREECSSEAESTTCSKRFVSPDNVEWWVHFSRKGKTLQAIELVHDQKFSGLAASYNILFYK
jgi:hypothetical protein